MNMDMKATSNTNRNNNINFVDLVRERTILTERPPLVDEVSVNFSGGSLTVVFSVL
jgi:hypothetical protein